MYDNPWWYNGEVFDSDGINGYHGFVYLITNTLMVESTSEENTFGLLEKRKVRTRRQNKNLIGKNIMVLVQN